MAEPFIGSEAVANGDVVKSALRTRHTALDLGCWYPTDEAVAAIDSLRGRLT